MENELDIPNAGLGSLGFGPKMLFEGLIGDVRVLGWRNPAGFAAEYGTEFADSVRGSHDDR